MEGNKFGEKSLCNEIKGLFFLFVVGGGSAGSVLAARLSEDPMTKVLLLEHGSSPPPLLSSIPVLGAFFQKSPYDWQYETVPQSNACKAMMHKVC